MVLQTGIPGLAELLVMLLVVALTVGISLLVYRDAKRRGADVPALWGVATFLALPTFFGIVVVGVLYYVFVVSD